MHQAGHLSGNTDAQSVNQSVRWVITKEVHKPHPPLTDCTASHCLLTLGRQDHASKIISTVAEYFLTQKVKDPPAQSDAAAYQASSVTPAQWAL